MASLPARIPVPQAADNAYGPLLDRPGEVDYPNRLAIRGNRAGHVGEYVFSRVAAGRHYLLPLCARARIPHANRAVPTAGNQGPAVPRESNRGHPPTVPPSDHGSFFAGSGFPQAHDPAIHAREHFAVGGKGQRTWEIPTPLTAAQFL